MIFQKLYIYSQQNFCWKDIRNLAYFQSCLNKNHAKNTPWACINNGKGSLIWVIFSFVPSLKKYPYPQLLNLKKKIEGNDRVQFVEEISSEIQPTLPLLLRSQAVRSWFQVKTWLNFCGRTARAELQENFASEIQLTFLAIRVWAEILQKSSSLSSK